MTTRLRVERRDYSAKPWRIVDADSGHQVTHQVEVTHHDGLTSRASLVETYLAFDTKREAILGLGDYAGRLYDQLTARASCACGCGREYPRTDDGARAYLADHEEAS